MADADNAPKKNRQARPRGFAAMSLEKRRAISRLGGASVPSEKRSFSQNKALAVDAGRKGGGNSRGGRPKPGEV